MDEAFLFIGHAYPKVKTRTHLGKVGEVFATHARDDLHDIGLPSDPLKRRQRRLDQGIIVEDARIAFAILHFIGGPMGFGDTFEDAMHHVDDAIPETGIIGTHGAAHLHFFGKDVFPLPALQGTDADDQRLTSVGLAAANRLQGRDGLGCDNNRIHSFMRCRAMGHLATDGDVETVAVGTVRTNAVGDLTGLEVMKIIIKHANRRHRGRAVQPENGIRFGIGHRPLRDHQLGTPISFVRRRHGFLRRLEEKLHRSMHLIAMFGEQFRESQRHGRVHIMTAGMHDPGVPRTVRHGAQFLDWQCVHVCPNGHAFAFPTAFEQGHYAMLGDARLHLQSKSPETIRHQGRRALLFIGEFRIRMDVTADFHQFWKHLVNGTGKEGIAAVFGLDQKGHTHQQERQDSHGAEAMKPQRTWQVRALGIFSRRSCMIRGVIAYLRTMLDITGQKIAVLFGGPGSEREVSVKTAESVIAALKSKGAEVIEVDITGPDFVVPEGVLIAMNLIHGTFGEDGQLQSILESRGIRYTGAGVQSSRTAFDKAKSKEKFIAAGVPTPRSQNYKLDGSEPLSISVPLVSKPPREGSSVGVNICRTEEEWAKAAEEAKKFGSDTLVEEFVEGKELTIGILGDQVLPIIHIEPVEGFYDINNKYPWMNGTGKTLYHCPAHLDEATTKRVQDAAMAAFKSCGTEVYGRVDIMLREDNEPFVLEINTIPGMTSSSLLPKAAAAVGIEFPDLCVRIIELSLAARP